MSGTMTEESSTEPPWIHTTTGGETVALGPSPASRQCRRTPVGRTTSGRADPLLQVARVAGHGVRAQPVHHRDEEIDRERADLAVVDDLGGLGQVHEADD